MIILIDTGSTNNFLDPAVVKKSGLPVNEKERVKVRVASGEMLPSEGQITLVRAKIQNRIFLVDIHAFIMVGCDMVLGTQWLGELGSVF